MNLLNSILLAGRNNKPRIRFPQNFFKVLEFSISFSSRSHRSISTFMSIFISMLGEKK